MAVNWVLSSKQRQLRLPPMAAGSSGLFHGCRHQIAVPGPRAAFSDAARNTLLGPLAPSGLQAQHWATRAQLGSLPTPHWPLPASHSGWKGAESLLHPIPPRRQYLALNSPYQFGIAKLEFLRFIPKTVKVEHATGPGCDAEPMLRSLEFYGW